MLKTIVTAASLVLASIFSPVYAAEQAAQPEQSQTSIPNPYDPTTWIQAFTTQGQGGEGAVNPFDPSSWSGTPASAATMQFNPAHPSGWAMFFNPATHMTAHRAFANPATYAQFMTPQFYMQFMNPSNWMAWMNPASYATFMNPANYTYWMNPTAYTHVMDPSPYFQGMNPANYMAYMNPMTYMQWMNPASYSVPGFDLSAAGTGTGGFNWFDPSAWGTQTQKQPAETNK